jgi:tRNA (cmo5U34)-methyltransferase
MAVNFDRVAPFYDSLARMVFGKALQQSQLYTLDHIPGQASVLILGGGTGWYLRKLLQQKQVSKIVYIEASEVMLKLSRRKTSDWLNTAQVEFRWGTESSLQAGERFDVIVTHFVLDLFTAPQVRNMITLLSKALQPGGIWLCSDFELCRKEPGYVWKKSLVKAMYLFFGSLSRVEARILPDIHGLFTACHFRSVAEASFYHQLIKSRVYRRADEQEDTLRES